MVFGGTAARSSAIPTPTEGMTTYRTDTNQLETFDGTQYRGMSGLQLLKRQTIGSGVSTVFVSSAFTDVYENYRIIINGAICSVNTDLLISFGTGNHYGSTRFDAYTGASTGFLRSNNFSSLYIGGVNNTLPEQSVSLDVYAPFLTRSTSITGNYYGNTFSGYIAGTFASTSSVQAFTLLPFAGTLTGGTISVYGYGV